MYAPPAQPWFYAHTCSGGCSTGLIHHVAHPRGLRGGLGHRNALLAVEAPVLACTHACAHDERTHTHGCALCSRALSGASCRTLLPHGIHSARHAGCALHCRVRHRAWRALCMTHARPHTQARTCARSTRTHMQHAYTACGPHLARSAPGPRCPPRTARCAGPRARTAPRSPAAAPPWPQCPRPAAGRSAA